VRRLVECLGRDRTKHQVAEVTSLGLVQMTRKRVGSGSSSLLREHVRPRSLRRAAAGADDAPAADAPEAADAALAPAPVPAGDDAAGVATESARMGWPQDGEEHLVAGSPTGLGWPPADDVPLGPPSPAPATASRSRRRRGRVSAPAGPPPRLDEETAQDVSQAGSDSGRYEGDQG
jgi:ribonuclease E